MVKYGQNGWYMVLEHSVPQDETVEWRWQLCQISAGGSQVTAGSCRPSLLSIWDGWIKADQGGVAPGCSVVVLLAMNWQWSRCCALVTLCICPLAQFRPTLLVDWWRCVDLVVLTNSADVASTVIWCSCYSLMVKACTVSLCLKIPFPWTLSLSSMYCCFM